MYEEHDTDARTHATDLNGVGDTDMEFRRGFWDFTILFYYHEEIIHPPSSDILAYLLTSARRCLSYDIVWERHTLRRRSFTSWYRFG